MYVFFISISFQEPGPSTQSSRVIQLQVSVHQNNNNNSGVNHAEPKFNKTSPRPYVEPPEDEPRHPDIVHVPKSSLTRIQALSKKIRDSNSLSSEKKL